MTTHYEILGIRRDAGPDEVKRRFRELARKWHPDVAKTPDAAERFKAINEAYRVLSNPESRAQYDAELTLQEARAAANRHSRQAPRPQAGGQARRPAGAPRGDGASRNTRTSSTGRPQADDRVAAEVHRLVHEAEMAMRGLRFLDASNLCRRILQFDRRNARAHEILGDIANARGRTEEALKHYTVAAQLDPRNARLQEKVVRTARVDLSSSTRAGTGVSSGDRVLRQMPALFGGMVVFTLILVAVQTFVSAEASVTFVPLEWGPALLLGLPCAGVVVGWTCAVAGLVRPAHAELLMPTASRGGRSVVPMGVVLIILSLVCFWIAAGLYLVMAMVQEAVSRSIFLAFGACACIVGAFALVVGDAAMPVLFLGGNMVFPAFVAGWALADGCRR